MASRGIVRAQIIARHYGASCGAAAGCARDTRGKVISHANRSLLGHYRDGYREEWAGRAGARGPGRDQSQVSDSVLRGGAQRQVNDAAAADYCICGRGEPR